MEDNFNIVNLELKTKLTLTFTLGDNTYEFPTSVIKKENNCIYIDVIRIENKILNFSTSNTLVSLIWSKKDNKPISFNNCLLSIINDRNASYYQVVSSNMGVSINRRNSFRVSIALPCNAQLGAHTPCVDAYIKDISATGFAFACDEEIKDFNNKVIRVSFDDFNFNYNIILSGNIIRSKKLENGKYIYGCRYEKEYPQLSNYILLKQREELAKSRNVNAILNYDKYKHTRKKIM